jgi:hypothetical protein
LPRLTFSASGIRSLQKSAALLCFGFPFPTENRSLYTKSAVSVGAEMKRLQEWRRVRRFPAPQFFIAPKT